MIFSFTIYLRGLPLDAAGSLSIFEGDSNEASGSDGDGDALPALKDREEKSEQTGLVSKSKLYFRRFLSGHDDKSNFDCSDIRLM